MKLPRSLHESSWNARLPKVGAGGRKLVSEVSTFSLFCSKYHSVKNYSGMSLPESQSLETLEEPFWVCRFHVT